MSLAIGIGLSITFTNPPPTGGSPPPPETFHVLDDLGSGGTPGAVITDDLGSGGTPNAEITNP